MVVGVKVQAFADLDISTGLWAMYGWTYQDKDSPAEEPVWRVQDGPLEPVDRVCRSVDGEWHQDTYQAPVVCHTASQLSHITQVGRRQEAYFRKT